MPDGNVIVSPVLTTPLPFAGMTQSCAALKSYHVAPSVPRFGSAALLHRRFTNNLSA